MDQREPEKEPTEWDILTERMQSLGVEFSRLVMKESMKMFMALDKNKSPEQIINIIKIQFLPKLKRYLVTYKNDVEEKRIRMQTVHNLFNTIDVGWAPDNFVKEGIELINKTYRLLDTRLVQNFLIRNIKLFLDKLFLYSCELYQIMYPIIQQDDIIHNIRRTEFDDILQELVPQQTSYQQMFFDIFGRDWTTHIGNVDPRIFDNIINFKNVKINADMKEAKSAEIQLFIKYYNEFFKVYYDGFVKLGEKVLPDSVIEWLPVSTDRFFAKPMILNLCHNYIFVSDFKSIATTIICSKEFMNALAICKKIFQ